MSATWFPKVGEQCNNCMVCVEFCPHGVYENGENVPVVVNPENCVHGCRGCESECPQRAISYQGDDGSSGGCSFSRGTCC
ncbi:4Fe-4S dicluster domain-containing protein [Metallumcola ferriviriculae]|uniref:4Fe-4S dicluster domain-containing protein n=1 Tax=Metallumcola ferriviriculae TaxID=3039180 RepID=A0AAU0UNJ7_9FIRM|nr:4Fe-4S dicluster domain-containing protein [Desulfitibacteraceae bacterium MK1]